MEIEISSENKIARSKRAIGLYLSAPALVKWTKRVAAFLVGQGLVQAVGAVTGLLLLRWLPVEAYSQLGITFGFQCTLALLVDLGLSSSIIALVGDRGDDPQVVGAYVRAGRLLRNRLLLIVVPCSAFFFHVLAQRQHWSWVMEGWMFASIVASLFFQGLATFYSAPLLIHHKLRSYYGAQFGGAGARFAGAGLLHLVSALTSTAAAWLGTVSSAVAAFTVYCGSRFFLKEPKQVDPGISREMFRYILPMIPGVIFFALQGQLSVFLIGFFGRSRSVAEIAALGRLGQILGIVGGINGVLIIPYIARVNREKLALRYCQILAGATFFCMALVLMAFMFPSTVLLLLGPKYSQLHRETGLSLLVWSLGYLAQLMFSLHTSRKWIYWWGTALNIAAVSLVQILSIYFMDLTSTINVICFSLYTAVAVLVTQIILGVYGFRYGPPRGLTSLRMETAAT